MTNISFFIVGHRSFQKLAEFTNASISIDYSNVRLQKDDDYIFFSEIGLKIENSET